LTRLAEEVPGFKDLINKIPPPLPLQEKITGAYVLARHPPPGIYERDYHLGQLLKLELFSPYHQWLYLLAPIWFKWSQFCGEEEMRSSRASRAYGKFKYVTSDPESHFIWGYSALESMKMIRTDDGIDEDNDTKELRSRWMMGSAFPGLILGVVSFNLPSHQSTSF
jgi:hypothetical protein